MAIQGRKLTRSQNLRITSLLEIEKKLNQPPYLEISRVSHVSKKIYKKKWNLCCIGRWNKFRSPGHAGLRTLIRENSRLLPSPCLSPLYWSLKFSLNHTKVDDTVAFLWTRNYRKFCLSTTSMQSLPRSRRLFCV